MKKERTDPLEKRVFDFCQDAGLLEAGRTVVVGVSGGPDSLCLLHTLHSLRGRMGISLHVAHLDHRLRGAEGEADARYVRLVARRLGLPVTVARREVRSFQAEHRTGVEEAAREVRYGFLAEVAERVGASSVAVGHTASDQVETVLLHLVRGSGTRGLRGMEPRSRWRSRYGSSAVTVVRPLLSVARQETLDYCSRRRLSPRSDASNASLSLLRNRVRHELLPLLRRYNPGVDAVLLRGAALTDDDERFLESQVDAVLPGLAARQQDGFSVERGAFLGLAPALGRRLLRRLLSQLLGSLTDVEAVHIEAMMAAARGTVGARVSLPGGLVFVRDYDSLYLGPELEDDCPWPPLEGEHRLVVPGVTVLPGWRVTVEPLDAAAAWDRDPWHPVLDADAVGSKLWVRPRRPGDRFRPAGLGGSKKLQDFLVDARVPRAWRGRLPLLASEAGIVAVVGYRVDERYAPRPDSRRLLRMAFERRQDLAA